MSEDASGRVLSVKAESSFSPARAGAITALKHQLPGWMPPHLLSSGERDQVLSDVKLITGPTAVDFFKLMSQNIRWALLDLDKRYRGPKYSPPVALRPMGPAPGDQDDAPGPMDEPAADSNWNPARQAAEKKFYCDIHRYVDSVEEKERVLFDLLFYQGLRQVEAAKLLKISEPEISKRWSRARQKAAKALNRWR